MEESQQIPSKLIQGLRLVPVGWRSNANPVFPDQSATPAPATILRASDPSIQSPLRVRAKCYMDFSPTLTEGAVEGRTKSDKHTCSRAALQRAH